MITPQRTYAVAGMTGTMAAALAQDAIVFAMFAGPSSDGLAGYLEALKLTFQTIVAFTTPITASRRLGIYRASGVAATGGAALGVVKKKTGAPASIVTDARIATTAALTVAGITREADPIAFADLVHVGAAGGRAEFLYEFNPPRTPTTLNPGELLVVSNPVAMDAAGTWQLGVQVDWRELQKGL